MKDQVVQPYREECGKYASKVEEKFKYIKEWNQLDAILLDTANDVLRQTTGKEHTTRQTHGYGKSKINIKYQR